MTKGIVGGGSSVSARRRRLASGLALGLSLAVALVAFAPGAGAGNGADGSTYVLTSFAGTSLLGLNDQGRTFDASLTTSTSFRQAQLDKYWPTDPYQEACRQAAASYNTVQTSDGYSGAIAALAASSCKARVLLDTRSLPPNPIRIKSFQPVP